MSTGIPALPDNWCKWIATRFGAASAARKRGDGRRTQTRRARARTGRICGCTEYVVRAGDAARAGKREGLVTNTHTHTHLHAHSHTDTQTHTRTHTYMHTYIHAYTHTYILIDTHSHPNSRPHTQTHTDTHRHT